MGAVVRVLWVSLLEVLRLIYTTHSWFYLEHENLKLTLELLAQSPLYLLHIVLSIL